VSHAPQQACPWEHLRGFLRRFAVGVLVGLLVFFALSVLRYFEIPFVQQLERAGNDVIMRFYAAGRTGEEAPTVAAIVLNDSENIESSVSNLIDLVDKLQSFDLKALILDLQIKSDTDPQNRKKLARLADLLKKSKEKFSVVAVAADATPANIRDRWDVQTDFLSAAGPGAIVRVLPGVIEDSDGVVRRVAPWACAHNPDSNKWTVMPTMAFALKGALAEDCPSAEPSKAERLRILFQTVPADGEALESSAISVISLSKLTSNAAMDRKSLDHAIVVVGQSRWADTYRTPVGLMPGLLVQANAVWTVQHRSLAGESALYDAIGETWRIAMVAALLATLPVLQYLLLNPIMWALGRLQSSLGATQLFEAPSIRWSNDRHDRPKTWSGVGRVGLEFVAASVGLAVLLLPLLGYMWPRFVRSAAENPLSGSASQGFLPIFAAALEGLIEVPEYLLEFLFLFVTVCSLFVAGAFARRRARNLLSLAAIILLSPAFAPSSVRAEDAGRLSIIDGKQDEVIVLRDNTQIVPAGGLLQSYDTVQLVGRTAEVEIVLFPRECKQWERLKYPRALYLVAPPANCDQESALHAFFEGLLWSPPERVRGAVTQLTRSIAGSPLALDRAAIVSRAAPGQKVTVPVTGNLRPLPQLDAREARLLVSGTGLALAWAGGTSPYEVAAELAETGEALGQQRSSEPYVWWPDWRMPPKPVTLTVTDANGRELHGTVLPADALPAGKSVDSTPDVITLFQDGGEWRLECLRRLAVLSASDKLAAQALAAIRVSGKDE
jgi:hypothetical protein